MQSQYKNFSFFRRLYITQVKRLHYSMINHIPFYLVPTSNCLRNVSVSPCCKADKKTLSLTDTNLSYNSKNFYNHPKIKNSLRCQFQLHSSRLLQTCSQIFSYHKFEGHPKLVSVRHQNER